MRYNGFCFSAGKNGHNMCLREGINKKIPYIFIPVNLTNVNHWVALKFIPTETMTTPLTLRMADSDRNRKPLDFSREGS